MSIFISIIHYDECLCIQTDLCSSLLFKQKHLYVHIILATIAFNWWIVKQGAIHGEENVTVSLADGNRLWL